MKLGESIDLVTRILGQGDKTQTEERRYRIELQALLDVFAGHPFDDSRWNITEAYTYRDAWLRGQTQANLEGKGTITYSPRRDHADSTQHEQSVLSGSGAGEGEDASVDGDHTHA